MSDRQPYQVGIGPCFVLGVVFLVLKLTHVIDWSWLWVLCPFWGPVALLVAFAIVVGVGALIVHLLR